MSTLKVNNIQNLSNVNIRGRILQVVQSSRQDVLLLSSSTFIDFLTVNITPASSSSQFLLIAQIGGSSANTGFSCIFTRNGTRLTSAEGLVSGSTTPSLMYQLYNYGSGSGAGIMSNPTFLDSPATSSTVTYKVQVKEVSGGTSYLGSAYYGYNAYYENRCANILTVMEVGP